MFFSKVISSAALVLALTLGVHAHAGVNPALGVKGNMARSDVKRPNNNCGGANVAASIDSSTAVQAAADGTFTATAVNFNGGADGSRQMSAVVDASGRGNAFRGNVQLTQNGQKAPQGTGSEQLTAKLPAGTRCTGGRTGNLCLVSFKSTAGFGNCVVVRQAGNRRRGLVAAGSRSPRALLQEIEPHSGEEAVEVVKRSVATWLWA